MFVWYSAQCAAHEASRNIESDVDIDREGCIEPDNDEPKQLGDGTEYIGTENEQAMADSTSGCPHRQYMDEPGIQWREGKPDFTKIDKAYLEGRTRTHKEGSLEKIVEDLVKTWEMEASHKTRIEDWQTVDREAFTVRANNQRSFNLKEAIEEGSYNVLMQNQPLYNSEAHTFESSHNLFRSAFSEGFPWELLEVFSGPPRVAFSWRHWAHWTGPYKGRAPTGELLEMHGMAVAEVDENLKIKSIDVHFDPNQLLMKLEGKK